jgi:response regulator RpfG family c-di-GMP phosphodiesterase
MVRILLTGYTDVEALVEAINCGLVYTYITKPWSNEYLRLKVSHAIEQYESNRKRNSLLIANERLLTRIKEMRAGFVRAMRDALKSKDEYLHDHGVRVSRHLFSVGQNMGLGEQMSSELQVAAMLQDVGAVGCSSRLPLKAGHRTSEYMQAVQENAQRGARILSAVQELRDVADILRFQQENFDGTGTPRGLVGEQIPLTSRILRVADEYHLLVNPRSPVRPLTRTEALDNLRERCGTELDPRVLEAFRQALCDDEVAPDELTGDLVESSVPVFVS